MTMRDLAARAAGAMMALLSGAAAAANPARSGAVTIPFALDEGNIVVDVELAPGTRLPFIVDSGLSNGNLVTTAAARILGLLATGDDIHLRDASGTASAGALTTIARIRVGEAVLADQTFAISEIPDEVTARDGKPAIAGFLGAPLLQGAVVCIDYRHEMLQRSPRRAFPSAGFAMVRMPLRHGLPSVRLRIDGLPATLVIDSGNNGGLQLFPGFVEKHRLRQRYPDLRVQAGTSGSGETYEILTGFARRVALAPGDILRDVPLSFVPQAYDPAWNIDGLAGYAFLSRLDPCLDRDGQRLLWRAGRAGQD